MVFLVYGVFVVVFSKSTQFGLHVWLPDAMEGPIPVSALIHAATLVTIGIILVFNFWQIVIVWFCTSNIVAYWLTLSITLIALGIINIVDLKKMIAYSTVYQIGAAMFITICIDSLMGIAYLEYHMYYKAALFMTTGIIIHTNWCFQDFRMFTYKLTGHITTITLTILITICSCSLWLCFGFYLKEIIIDDISRRNSTQYVENTTIMLYIITVGTIYATFIGSLKIGYQQMINITTAFSSDTEIVQIYCALLLSLIILLTAINNDIITLKQLNTNSLHTNYTTIIILYVLTLMTLWNWKIQLGVIDFFLVVNCFLLFDFFCLFFLCLGLLLWFGSMLFFLFGFMFCRVFVRFFWLFWCFLV